MRWLAAVSLILAVTVPTWAAAPRTPDRPKVGESSRVTGWWFQYLGEDDQGVDRWLFPHFDGVHEIFRAPRTGPWNGDLDTRFDPKEGVFENTFNGAEVLNEFLRKETTLERKQETAQLLKLWLAIHPARETPYYARDFVRDLDKYVSTEALTRVNEQLALRRRLLSRVGSPGVEVPGLQHPASPELGPQEYYRRMLQDGYLDIAIVSGNLRNDTKGTYHSWQYMEELHESIVKKFGFKDTRFRRADDETLSILHTKMLGQPVTVRLQMTGGSMRAPRIVRAVANFIEGMANADLFIYMGHSNYASGSYYISEADTPWSRFQIGLRDQRDLSAKCHLLRTHPYQLICFQSCSSYRKYAQPIRWYLARSFPDRPGRAGFMGTSEMCWFVDFVPRYTKLIELLLKEQGARTIQDAIQAIQPMPTTPPMILRGFLQPPASFILPEGISVANVREEDVQRHHHVLGDGSDGRTYRSTEVFAQNFAGEVVQVAEANNGLYGLTKDGRIYFCGLGTGGAALESSLTAKSAARFLFIGTVGSWLVPKPILLGVDGKVYRQDDRSGKLYLTREQAPEGVTFTAIGEDAGRRLIALDDKGRWYGWDHKTLGFVELKGPQNPLWEPSLLGRGTKGVLYAPEDLPVAR